MKVSDSPVPRSHKSELSEAKWMVPLETVEGAENGLYILPPPQAYELTRIIEAGRTGLQLEKIEIPMRICPQLVNDKENVSHSFAGLFLHKPVAIHFMSVSGHRENKNLYYIK